MDGQRRHTMSWPSAHWLPYTDMISINSCKQRVIRRTDQGNAAPRRTLSSDFSQSDIAGGGGGGISSLVACRKVVRHVIYIGGGQPVKNSSEWYCSIGTAKPRNKPQTSIQTKKLIGKAILIKQLTPGTHTSLHATADSNLWAYSSRDPGG